MKTHCSFVIAALLAAGSLLPSSSFAQSHDINVSSADLIWEGVQAGAHAGGWMDLGALSAGDARRDLVVGAPGGPGLVGAVYVIYGGPVRQGTVSLSSADASIAGETTGDLFGASTAVGNVLTLENADPRTLIVGAPNYLNGRGAVYVFNGGFGPHASLTTGSAVMKIIGNPGDQLGTMLATADLDNDGYREIIIGAPGNARVYIIKGGPGLNGTQDLSVAPATATLTAVGAGSVLAAGDVDGDNIADLLVAAPAVNAIYLYKGATNSIPTAPSAVFAGIDAGDLAGASIRLADMDGDGHRDILIGAPGAAGPGNSRANGGEVYLIWGGAAQVSRSLASADVTFYGIAGERLGAQMTIGDINRDLPNDAVMLADGAAGGNGILYIYYGRARAQFGTANADGTRAVDFANPANVSRRIGSDAVRGPITSAQVFEVTGEGARDIIVGTSGFNGGAGRVYFTLSPKLTISTSAIQMFVHTGATTQASIGVVNATAISITWQASPAAPAPAWMTLTPANGSAVDGAPGSVAVTVSAAGLAPGSYSATVNVSSTSPDLTMSLPVTVTIVVTNTIVQLDGPVDGSTVSQPFNIGGWAIDPSAASGVGVDAVHIWAFPVSGAAAVFLGVAPSGNPRPDVGAAFGHQFDNAGFNLQSAGLTPGEYRIAVYAHNALSQQFDAWQIVTVTVTPSARMAVDAPQAGSVNGTFTVLGWALDTASTSGPGIDAVHTWAFPAGGGSPMFLGVASYGDSRPDVGGVFGAAFSNSGFHLTVTNLATGSYTLVVYAHSSVTGRFDAASSVVINVLPSARMSIDGPASGSSLSQPFVVAGWALDLAAGSGTGVDAVHVWATPSNGGSAVFLGVASYGAARSDVGSAYGSRFTNSAYSLVVNGGALTPGAYTISVYAHSTVAGAFNDVAAATVTVK